MADVKPQVPYRQRQALETKRRIATTARRMFAEHGYAATSIESIAEGVGVAARTVYAAFGSKKAILGAICEQWLEESQIVTLIQEAMADPDPDGRLALLARASRRQWEQGVDVVAMLKAAAATDVEINRMLKGWASEREKAMGQVLSGMRGAFRRGVDLETASAVTRALTGPEIYESLVLESGWDPDRHQEWVHKTLVDQLLGGNDDQVGGLSRPGSARRGRTKPAS